MFEFISRFRTKNPRRRKRSQVSPVLWLLPAAVLLLGFRSIRQWQEDRQLPSYEGRSVRSWFDEYAKMRQLDLDMFKAMNDAGGANPSYPWVEAIVRLMRQTISMIVLVTWAVLKVQNISNESVDNFAAAVGFYLFADRTLFYSRKGK